MRHPRLARSKVDNFRAPLPTRIQTLQRAEGGTNVARYGRSWRGLSVPKQQAGSSSRNSRHYTTATYARTIMDPAGKAAPMISTDLTSNWEFRLLQPENFPRSYIKRPQWMPARVPGSIYLDLLANGVIADPFQDQHEAGLAWVDNSEWEYQNQVHLERDPIKKNSPRNSSVLTLSPKYR